jgi:hypothetical protein
MIAGDHAPNFPLKHAQKVSTLHSFFLRYPDSSCASAPCADLFARMSIRPCYTFAYACSFGLATLHASHIKYYTLLLNGYCCTDIVAMCMFFCLLFVYNVVDLGYAICY